MSKKITAYIFILIANLVILAHVFIPHHHHEIVAICFDKEHSLNNLIFHHHGGQDKNHQHDDSNKPESCSVSEFIATTADQGFRHHPLQYSVENHFQNIHFLNVSGNFEISVPFSGEISFLPYSSPQYSFFVSSSSGLRAPPVV